MQLAMPVGPLSITYLWKDAYLGSFSNSRLTFPRNFDGSIYKINLEKEFTEKSINCGFGYTENLPNIYHGIIKKDVINKHKIAHGNYLSGSSFDVYCAISLSKYTKSIFYIDYPFTIRGVCGKSNANRIVNQNMQAHFDEIKSLVKNVKIKGDYFDIGLKKIANAFEKRAIELFKRT